MTTEKYCHTLSDIPAGPHYAILRGASIYIPGDERSKQYPGHGYPASTEHYLNYIAYTDRAEWEAEVSRLAKEQTGQSPTFIAIQVTPAVVETTVKVSISTGQHVYTQRCPECGQPAESVLRDGFATRVCLCGNRWRPENDQQP